VVYGDGPHIAALALLALAILCIHVALQKRLPVWDLLAGLSMAAVALTNWLGAFALAAMAAAYLVRTRDWLRAAAIGAFAYVIACPWIPPSTVAAVRLNAQTVAGDFRNSSTLLLLFLPCAIVGLILMRKWSVFTKFGIIMAALRRGRAVRLSWED
jgi:hypothetical protein